MQKYTKRLHKRYTREDKLIYKLTSLEHIKRLLEKENVTYNLQNLIIKFYSFPLWNNTKVWSDRVRINCSNKKCIYSFNDKYSDKEHIEEIAVRTMLTVYSLRI